MACADWFRLHGISFDQIAAKGADSLNVSIYNDGIGCINSNQSFCDNFCADSTKNQTECFNCLTNAASCPQGPCRQKQFNCKPGSTDECCTVGCCPRVSSAVQCGNCVAARGGGTVENFQACFNTGGVSQTTTIIIVVCSVVGAIVIIASIVLTLQLRNRARARDKLINRLHSTGANEQVIQEVEDLNYADINPEIYQKVNRKLALQ